MSKRTWTGILIVLVGLGFLLQQAGVLPFTAIMGHWWPIIFIIVGTLQLIYHTQTSLFTGPIFIVIGALLLLNQWTNISLFNYIWPLILIYVGVVFIFFQTRQDKTLDESNVLRSFSFFSGSDMTSRSNPLKGGSVTAIFGGAEIDLRDAVIVDEQITLELTSFFGGISLRVPSDINVHVSGIPIFGGWEDKTRSKSNATLAPTIVIKCVTIFGGVEISD